MSNESRKILFVLSDGCVANRGNCGIGRAYYKKLINRIEKEGIVEPIGVGLFSEEIKHFYTKAININADGPALAKGLFEQLRKIFKV